MTTLATDLPLSIYPSKGKLLCLFIGSLGFVATGIWLISNPQDFHRYPPLITQAIGMASLVFFGFGSFVIMRMLFSNEPSLVANHTGLRLKRYPTPFAWSDIEDIRPLTVLSGRFRCIALFIKPDRLNHYANPSGIKSAKWAADAALVGTPFFISSSESSMKLAALASLLKQHLQSLNS